MAQAQIKMRILQKTLRSLGPTALERSSIGQLNHQDLGIDGRNSLQFG